MTNSQKTGYNSQGPSSPEVGLSKAVIIRIQKLTYAVQRAEGATISFIEPVETISPAVPISEKPLSATSAAEVILDAEQLTGEAVTQNVVDTTDTPSRAVAAAEKLTREAYASQNNSNGNQGDYELRG